MQSKATQRSILRSSVLPTADRKNGHARDFLIAGKKVGHLEPFRVEACNADARQNDTQKKERVMRSEPTDG